MGGIGQGRGLDRTLGGGGSASIDIDINSQSFLSGVSTNQDIPVELEGGAPVGVDVSGVWTILTSELITDLTDAQVVAIFSGRVSINVVEYTANDTYNKPTNLLFARVVCVGGGGGGGSGRRSTAGQNRRGGGGGGGGALTSRFLLESQISASTSITIGTGGTGGAIVSTDTTNGNAGTTGGDTSFGALVVSKGGLGGDGGAGSGSPAGGIGGSLFSCTPNVFPLATGGCDGGGGGNNAMGFSATAYIGFVGRSAGAGGGGGAYTTGDVISNGGDGSQAYNAAGSLSTAAAGGVSSVGTDGTDNYSMQIIGEYPVVPTNTLGVGTGGGGGSATYAGGAGGDYGAGGGGAGGTLNGGATAAGGNGAGGLCIIVEYIS